MNEDAGRNTDVQPNIDSNAILKKVGPVELEKYPIEEKLEEEGWHEYGREPIQLQESSPKTIYELVVVQNSEGPI